MSGKPIDKKKTASEPAPGRSGGGDVEAFLRKVAATPAPAAEAGRKGRLLFALDATASREAAWDRAMHIQAEMFREAEAVGGLEMQVAYYRGFGEFRATPWLSDGTALLRAMTKVRCMAGRTQIERVLRHAERQARDRKVNALVFVGDCMEEEVDMIADAAGRLGLRGVPAFMFHEGPDPLAARTFEQVARLTGGACCRFDASAPDQLRQLLRAVAVFAAGGRKALSDYGAREGGMARLLTDRLAGQR